MVNTVATPYRTPKLSEFEIAVYLVLFGGWQVYLPLISALFRLERTLVNNFDPNSTGKHTNRF
jgi:hypothetical protein